MSDSIQFYLEEHIDTAVAHAQRATRTNVSTTVEVNLRAIDDPSQMAFAVAERRAFVTDDVKFMKMANKRLDHAGIVFCHRDSRSLGRIIRALVSLHTNFKAQDLFGRVIYVPKHLPDTREI